MKYYGVTSVRVFAQILNGVWDIPKWHGDVGRVGTR